MPIDSLEKCKQLLCFAFLFHGDRITMASPVSRETSPTPQRRLEPGAVAPQANELISHGY